MRTFETPEIFLAQLNSLPRGCLLLDIRMPVITGLKLQEKLQAMSLDWPTIIISGHGDIETCRRAFRNGAIDFLSKPIDEQDLIEATQKQWRELGLNLPDEGQWLKDLASIWPDVNEGDVITLIVDAQQVSHFYLSNNNDVTTLGRLDNQAFGSSFLAIWLSKDTSRPDLRSQLIGYK